MEKVPISYSQTFTNFTLFLLLVLFSLGCSKEEENEVKSEVKLRKVDGEMKGREVPISTLIFKPKSITAMDNMLVVLDQVDNDMFKFLSYPNVKYLFSWGNKGSGPDEIEYVSYAGFLGRGNTFSFLDYCTYKTYKVSGSNELELVENIQLIDTQGALAGVNLLNDSVFFASLVDELKPKSEHIFLYPNMRKGYTFGEYPEEGIEFDYYKQRVIYYHKVNVVNWDKKRIMVFYVRLNLIKIYDYEGKLLKEIKLTGTTLPSEKYNDWITFGATYGTNNYAYVLYVNKALTEDYVPSPRDLIILNWEGDVIKRYSMDIPITNFVVSEKYKKVYGLNSLEGDKIIEFDLPDIGNY